MKKLVLLLALLMTVCLAVGALACKEEEKEQEYYVLADFESDDELLTINWFNMFGKVEPSTEHVTNGSHSAKMEVYGYNVELGAAPAPMFKVYTDTEYNQRADYTQAVGFEIDIYNDSDRDLELGFYFTSASYSKGGSSEMQTYTLKKKQANHVEIDFQRLYLNTFIDIQQISEFAFTLPLREAGEDPYVVYVDRFVAKMSKTPINKLTFDNKTSYIGKGETFNVPVIDNTEWTISYNGVLNDSLKNAEFFVAEQGKYDILYYAKDEDQTMVGMNTLLVEEVEDAVSLIAENPESIGLPIPTLEEIKEGLPFGVSGIRLHGKNLGVDTGVMLRTGIYNDLDGLSFYILNNSPTAIDAIFNGTGHNGRITMPAGQWSIFTQSAEYWNWYNMNHGLNGQKTASAYRETNGEWCFRIWLHGSGTYDVTILAFFDRGKMPPPDISFEENTLFVDQGDVVNVPKIDGATWTVSLDGQEIVDLKNAESFVAEGKGIYSIDYVKDSAEETFYVIVDQTELAVDFRVETSHAWNNPGIAECTAEMVDGAELGVLGVRLYGDGLGYDAGTIFNTGLKGDIVNLRFYVRNNNTTDMKAYFNGASTDGMIPVTAGQWILFEQDASAWNWYNENHGLTGSQAATAYENENGEWCFRVWLNGYNTFDVTIVAFFELKETEEVIELETDTFFAEVGETVSIPSFSGATWRVYLDNQEITELKNVSQFVAENVGKYTVHYSKTEGSEEVAVYTVFVEQTEFAVDFRTDTAQASENPGISECNVEAVGSVTLGVPGARLYGERLGYDTGLVFNTGLKGNLLNLKFYIRNNNTADVNVIFNGSGHEGIKTILAGEWIIFTQDAGLWNWYNTNHGLNGEKTASAYQNESGEWCFRIWLKGSNTFDATFVAFLELENSTEPEDPEITLQSTSALAEVGNEVSVPDVKDATWKIFLNGTEKTELANAKTFVAEAGIYTVNYTRTYGIATATAVYTVYAETYANAVDLRLDTAAGVSNLAVLQFTKNEAGAPFGTASYRLFNETHDANACVVVKTGKTGDLKNLKFYIYNNMEYATTYRFHGSDDYGGITTAQPGEWVVFDQPAEVWNQQNDLYQSNTNPSATMYKDANGEWVLSLWLTGGWYDSVFAMFMETEN